METQQDETKNPQDKFSAKLVDKIPSFVWSLCAILFAIATTLLVLGFNGAYFVNRYVDAVVSEKEYRLQLQKDGKVPLDDIIARLDEHEKRLTILESKAHEPSFNAPAEE